MLAKQTLDLILQHFIFTNFTNSLLRWIRMLLKFLNLFLIINWYLNRLSDYLKILRFTPFNIIFLESLILNSSVNFPSVHTLFGVCKHISALINHLVLRHFLVAILSNHSIFIWLFEVSIVQFFILSLNNIRNTPRKMFGVLEIFKLLSITLLIHLMLKFWKLVLNLFLSRMNVYIITWQQEKLTLINTIGIVTKIAIS